MKNFEFGCPLEITSDRSTHFVDNLTPLSSILELDVLRKEKRGKNQFACLLNIFDMGEVFDT